MSVTLTTQPTIPALSLNDIVYVVSTTETGDDWYIRCFLWIEDTPESDTWTNVADLIQPVIDGTAEINLQPYLNELLTYNLPDPEGDQVQVMNTVSRRYKVEFFEWQHTDLVLHQKVYHEDGSLQYKDITALEDAQHYLIVLDKQSSDVVIKDGSTTIDCDAPTNYLVGSGDNRKIGNRYHHGVLTTSANYDEIQLPSHTNAWIYKRVNRTHYQDTRVPFVLKAGMSKKLVYKKLQKPVLNLLSVDDTSIQLTITHDVTLGADIEVEFSTDGNSWASETTIFYNNGSYTYTDNSLTEDTEYHYRARARRGIRSSDWVEASAHTYYHLIDHNSENITDESGENLIGI